MTATIVYTALCATTSVISIISALCDCNCFTRCKFNKITIFNVFLCDFDYPFEDSYA